MKYNRNRSAGFTLIEILVVIAIIAVLTSIAVVNLLEAQVRSKVARAKADIKTIFVGLDMYAVDYKEYPSPQNSSFPNSIFLFSVSELTTPVAYLSSVSILDAFKPSWKEHQGVAGLSNGDSPPAGWKASYGYFNFSSRGAYWRQMSSSPPLSFKPFEGCAVTSVGPDLDIDGLQDVPARVVENKWVSISVDSIYDPTNGTRSSGDIGRWTGRPSYFGAF